MNFYRLLPEEGDGTDEIVCRVIVNYQTKYRLIDTSGGPPPDPHNFYRGGSVSIYDEETRTAIADLDGEIDTDAATAVWDAALEATWEGSPVWLDGNISYESARSQPALKRSHRLRVFGCR